ncbi:hypothetical protein BCV72DRAFT_207538, partial [Rhizopus microsporus var. microsporus]
KFEIPVQSDYGPLDFSSLRDTNCDNWDEVDKTWAARGQYIFRIFGVLYHVSGTVNQNVANLFANKGYIDRNECPELFPIKKT